MKSVMIRKSKIFAPASKSYLQRAMIIAALTKGRAVLRNISWCDDTLAVKGIVQQLGASVREEKRNLIIESNGLNIRKNSFCVGESGLAVRMLSPILALSDKEVILKGKGSLLNRPVSIIADALEQLGVRIETVNNFLPIKILGPVKPGKIEIDGSLSSQVLTGLLIALPLADGDTEIKVLNLKSKPYIEMSLDIVKHFGVEIVNDNYQTFFIKGNQKYKPTEYVIEGDWSGAAFLLVAGAISGEVEVLNLAYNSKQADKRIIDVLRNTGADVTINDNSVIVKKNNLNPFEFDATDSPDLFPPLVCLAAACNGISVIKGVSRLKYKESDRAKALKKEFEKIGVRIELSEDYMKVFGAKIKGAEIDSSGDHRIAMAAGVINLVSDTGIIINNKEVVEKSYPAFFKDMNVLAGI